MPKEKPAEETPQLPVSEQETQIQASSFLDKLKVQKKKILIGLGSFFGILVFVGVVFGAYKLGQRQVSPTAQITSPPIVTKAPTPTLSLPTKKPFSLASITLMFYSSDASVANPLAPPAELLVTDPLGRRTGLDPRTGTVYDEIPDDTSYSVEELVDASGQGGPAASPVKVFHSPAPIDGSYIIQIIGTESGGYTLDILIHDELGGPAEEIISGDVETGNVAAHRMDFSSAPGAEVEISRADDVGPN